MRLTVFSLLLLAPAILSMPSPTAEHSIASSSSSTSIYSRLGSILLPQRRSHLVRPLNGYEDEDYHNPPPPRRLNGTQAQTETRTKRASYPRCSSVSTQSAKGARRKMLGVAHYPGWKLSGDDLSGAVPVHPRSNCATVCSRYGAGCSGTFYDDVHSQCYMKGTKTSTWSFSETDLEGDGTDLIGGCAAWSGFVPPEMDDICCRD